MSKSNTNPTDPQSDSAQLPAAGFRQEPKPQQLLALLSGDQPVRLDRICAAFGWQPHSARAAVSGLRKAGHLIEAVKGEDGAAGYRVAVSNFTEVITGASAGAGECEPNAATSRKTSTSKQPKTTAKATP